jgi:hypothetical protein
MVLLVMVLLKVVGAEVVEDVKTRPTRDPMIETGVVVKLALLLPLLPLSPVVVIAFLLPLLPLPPKTMAIGGASHFVILCHLISFTELLVKTVALKSVASIKSVALIVVQLADLVTPVVMPLLRVRKGEAHGVRSKVWLC